MQINEERYGTYDCWALSNGTVTLRVARDFGPRIVGYTLNGGVEMLVQLPQFIEPTPSGAMYHFRGGHRLWHAPEHPARTYVPDNAPPTLTVAGRCATLTQPVEALTGIEKALSITLDDQTANVTIEHRLTNRGDAPFDCAPWAITQFKPGGLAILPQSTSDSGLLPNRRLAIWPYTDLNAPNLHLDNRYITIEATLDSSKFKLGWANERGWQGYWLDGTLFVKSAEFDPSANYPDFGSSAECYCGPEFLELETLGGMVTLDVGATASHVERWQLHDNLSLTNSERVIEAKVDQLGLDG